MAEIWKEKQENYTYTEPACKKNMFEHGKLFMF